MMLTPSNPVHRSAERGQAALVILLLMVVLLTIGISIASRSITDLRLSRQEEDSNRALNAAEAGIETALSQDFNFSGTTYQGSVSVDPAVSVNYTIQKVGAWETRLFKGISAQVDLSGSQTGNNVVIRWGKETNCNQSPASLMIRIFRNTGTTTKVRTKLAYAPCSTHNDRFTVVSTDPSGELFRQVTIPLQSGDTFMRVKPLYNDTYLSVTGSGWTLPTQQYQVKSVAGTTQGDETRAVQVNRTRAVVPSIFDYAVFSGTTIVK
jgi:hypothetical protein